MMRIVSLLPSATEIVCALGLGQDLVGVTHECDYPRWVRDLPKVTRTLIPHDASSGEIDVLVRERLRTQRALYTLDMPTLEELRPDLIVTQALCDVCAVAADEVHAAACRLPGRPTVVNLEPRRLDDVFSAIGEVARVTGVTDAGAIAIAALQGRVDAVVTRSRNRSAQARTLLLEWLDPPFSCGHWNPELVRLAGGIEQLGREGEPSRTLRWEEVIASRPEVVVIACCGFDMARTMTDVDALTQVPGWRELPAVQSDRVFVVDGSQYFSRPGPRLVDSLEMLAHAIDPARHPLPQPLESALVAIPNTHWPRVGSAVS